MPKHIHKTDRPIGLSQPETARMLNVFDESQRAVIASTLANMRQGQRTDIELSANLPKVKSKKDSTFQVANLPDGKHGHREIDE